MVTVVPAPGRLEIAARPPAASIRPVIDSRIPRRDGGVAAGSNPRPLSVTLTTAQPVPPVTVTSAAPVPACRATLRSASPTQATSWSATGDGSVTGTSFSRTARPPVLAAARSSFGPRSVSSADPPGSAGQFDSSHPSGPPRPPGPAGAPASPCSTCRSSLAACAVPAGDSLGAGRPSRTTIVSVDRTVSCSWRCCSRSSARRASSARIRRSFSRLTATLASACLAPPRITATSPAATIVSTTSSQPSASWPAPSP